MTTQGLLRRVTRTLLASVVMAGAVVALAATPAAARSTTQPAAATSWAYTDSHAPDTVFADPSGDLPVGAWLDDQGERHLSKAYFTFDLSAFAGARILHADTWTTETGAADCTKDRSTELWRADVSERPTWTGQPAERVRQGDSIRSTSCGRFNWLLWDTTEAVTTAVAAGSTKVTLVLLMPQDDLAFARRSANDASLTVTYNRAPNVPTQPWIGLHPCTDDSIFIGDRYPSLRAFVSDPDVNPTGSFDYVAARFTVWDVADPEHRAEWTTSGGYREHYEESSLPVDLLVDDHTYEWTARSADGDDVSAPSAPCRFTADFTAPGVETEVSSVDYPEGWNYPGTGGPGLTGEFTFGSAGVADVAGYLWAEHDQPVNFVAAEGLGGIAKLRYAPRSSGTNRIRVISVDRAGNRSPLHAYEFWVRNNLPLVTSTPERGALGEPMEFAFAPGMDGVVEYTYQLNGGEVRTIAADGERKAKISVTPTKFYSNSLVVQSRTSAGVLSGANSHHFYIDGAEPGVSSVDYPEGPVDGAGGPGVAGTFEFTSNLPGTVEFVYTLEGGPEIVVAAGPDGRASTSITPTSSGYQELHVRARRADGITSAAYEYGFRVND